MRTSEMIRIQKHITHAKLNSRYYQEDKLCIKKNLPRNACCTPNFYFGIKYNILLINYQRCVQVIRFCVRRHQ